MDSMPCIAIIGGDRRETVLAEELKQLGYRLKLCGAIHEKDGVYKRALDAIAGVQAVILPMAGLEEVSTKPYVVRIGELKIGMEFFHALPPGLPVLIGRTSDAMRAAAPNTCFIEMANDPELATLNSIPTAEGALAIAMAEAPITIWGSDALILGFGRCGFSLARLLAGFGALVTVVARGEEDRARARAMGFKTRDLSDILAVAQQANFIFNTVPALLLTRAVLAQTKACYVVVDIASGGGTDFQAAEELGIRAVLAPGLPGKMAPVTAGKLLALVYPRVLAQWEVGKGVDS